MGRGVNSRVITDMNQPWGTSETCTSCGKCIQVCPTGALFQKGKAVSEMSKRNDFLPYIVSMRHKGEHHE
jgi:bidirectional [NiFe] hydrogenase diaphorase subunit